MRLLGTADPFPLDLASPGSYAQSCRGLQALGLALVAVVASAFLCYKRPIPLHCKYSVFGPNGVPSLLCCLHFALKTRTAPRHPLVLRLSNCRVPDLHGKSWPRYRVWSGFGALKLPGPNEVHIPSKPREWPETYQLDLSVPRHLPCRGQPNVQTAGPAQPTPPPPGTQTPPVTNLGPLGRAEI